MQPSSILRGLIKKEGEGVFIEIERGRIKGNGFKLKRTRFRLTVRQRFCTMRVVRH